MAWAAIYDEDFFLDRRRAVEFFRLWDASPLQERYRISVQTNPCSLLDSDRRPRAELFHWIDRVKPMIQLGAESFHADLLRRWHKRHTVEQLRAALDALDLTRQDYSVFILLTDFQSTPEEVIETLRQLVVEAFSRRWMRIASSAMTIPLYDSDTRKLLEYGGLPAGVQGLCLPFRGFSRSGATISTALLGRIDRALAEDLSFALAVALTPPVLYLELHRYLKAAGSASAAHFGPAALGMVASFLAGLLALRWLSSWLERGRWSHFGYYCLLASATLAVLHVRGVV